jgi:hypothetical protein
VDLDEIIYEGVDIEDDLDSVLLSLIASTIPKWRMFKFLRWVQRNSLITFELICGFGRNFV